MEDLKLPGLTKLENFDVKTFLTKAALTVEATAKLKCPVDTGQLRQSISHNIYDDYAEIGTNYEYAPYVEYGTGLYAAKGDGRKTRWSYQDADGNWHSTIGQKPQPFLQPALDENKTAIEDIAKACIKKEIK